MKANRTILILISCIIFQATYAQIKATVADSVKVKPKDATQATAKVNEALKQYLPFKDTTSFMLAKKGFIAPVPSTVLKTDMLL